MAGPFAVHTSNNFALLDEDAPMAPPPEKKVQKKEKEAKKKQEPRKENKAHDSNKDRPQRNGSGEGNRNRDRPKGGRPRGGRGGKREFDRRSGSGRRDTQRKDGAGKHNWGAAGDQEERKNAAEEKAAPAEENAEETAPAGEGAEGAEAEPAEPAEPEQLTYDEVLARRAANALEDDTRKARREVDNDDSLFKTANDIEVDNEEAELESKYELGVGGKSKKGKKKNAKKSGTVNIDEFMSNNPQRKGNRGGRGGRGGGRGGKGGRGGRITIDDKNFPKLG